MALGVAVAHGQAVPSQVVNQAVNAALPTTIKQNPSDVSPLQPQGWPNPKEQAGFLGQPKSDLQILEIVHAGYFNRDGDDVRIGDGVEFNYHGYHITGESAFGNLQTSIFTIKGNVRVEGKDTVVTGDEITVNGDNQTFRAVDADSILSPKIVGGGLLDNLYVKGGEEYGSQQEIWGRLTDLTTCNLPHPHYDILADSSDIRPGRRAILRHAKVRLFSRVLIDIPYISVPLDDRSYKYLPVVGYDDIEGYFIKFRFGVPLKGNNDLDVRTDYMSKLGAGLGGDYRYFNREINGYASVYTVPNIDEIVVSNDHKEKFSFGTFQFDNDFEKNNYLTSPGATVDNIRAQLVIPEGTGSADRLSFSDSTNSNNGFDSQNQTISLDDSRRFGTGIQTTLDVNWLTNSSSYTSLGATSPTETSSEQIDVQFKGTDQLKKADVDLEYVRSIPVGQSAAYAGAADKSPYLDLASDAQRLFGAQFAQALPFKTDFSWGEFTDPTSLNGGQIGRYDFDFDFNRPDRSAGPLRMDMSGEFHQGVYSDDTAQYTLGFNDQVSYKLGPDTSANLHYNYLRAEGYTPLSIDYTGNTNLLSGDISYRPWKPFLIGAQTGYDFDAKEESTVAWQEASVRSEFTPSKYFLWRTLSTYDTYVGEWTSSQMDFSYKRGTTFYGLGTRYDGTQKVWSNVNLFVNGFEWGKTKLSVILNWDGYTKQFDTEQIAMTYDLHCAEAIVQYTVSNYGFNPGTTVALFLRIKALPYGLPFGFGNSGQPLGYGTGQGY